MIEFKDIAIKGISACVPASTQEISDSKILSEGEKKTIQKHYKINRVHKSTSFTTFDLCLSAAKKLISSIGWNSTDIDFLISVTQTPDYLMPSNTGAYQQHLNLNKRCIAFEVNTGCTGYIQAIMIASGFLQNKGFKKGLILCGETTYNVGLNDKSSLPYMGDAGTATAIEFSKNSNNLIFNATTDGSFADAIQIPKGGARSYTNNFDEFLKEDLKVKMDGEKVKNFIFSEAIRNIDIFFKQFKIDKNKIDFFVFHQVNHLIIKNLAKKLEIPFLKLLSSFEEYGNNSSASIPTCICHNARQFNSNPKTLFLSGFGIGMSNYNLLLSNFTGKVLEVSYL